jgi:hypothetical protein
VVASSWVMIAGLSMSDKGDAVEASRLLARVLNGQAAAQPSSLAIDKITHLDGRFRYVRTVSMRGVIQRGLRCYRH